MTINTFSRHVTRNHEILGGEPIINGTRTSVRAIVGLWRLGIMPEEIPGITHLNKARVMKDLSKKLLSMAAL
ncbi:DUF433 domain-containing protein [Synechocystis salina LEGE 06099]|uniref:DUF433 domain-containing protein n=1 Tax=Synechocystis salina TaxID=945780 RepID=UPI00187DF15E|nr:DUF433 domain-containing protein [Synechocystis salina]MBE9203926.1 DUF433 domain-containing protein [Synechocystis salina LEGE 06099]